MREAKKRREVEIVASIREGQELRNKIFSILGISGTLLSIATVLTVFVTSMINSESDYIWDGFGWNGLHAEIESLLFRVGQSAGDSTIGEAFVKKQCAESERYAAGESAVSGDAGPEGQAQPGCQTGLLLGGQPERQVGVHCRGQNDSKQSGGAQWRGV